MGEITPKHTVVLLGSDEHFQESYIGNLEEAGFQVLTARSGFDVLNFVRQYSVEAIVASGLEQSDGETLDLLRDIRHYSGKHPAFIFYAPEGIVSTDQKSFLRQGADGVIDHPVDELELVDIIYSTLFFQENSKARKHPRVEKSVEVYAIFDGGPSQKLRTHNLSPRGMFLICPYDLPMVGSVIRFSILNLNGEKAIDGQGTVRWVRQTRQGIHPKGIGIEFFELKPENLRNLEQLLRK